MNNSILKLSHVMKPLLAKIPSRWKTLVIYKLLGKPLVTHKKKNFLYRVYREQDVGFLVKISTKYPFFARWFRRLYKIQGSVYGESGVIKTFVNFGDTVFDVGANVGDWTRIVLNQSSDVKVHLFEPVSQNFQLLLQNFTEPINRGKLVPNNCAVARQRETRTSYYYEDANPWSTFYERLDIEKRENLKPPKAISVSVTTLDSYCQQSNINRIHFLKIDVEGAELDVLYGARNLLKKGRIDFLQFEYGGTYLCAGITLQQVFAYLQEMRYAIFKILPTGLAYRECFLPEHETFEYSNFLAINARFRSKILGEPPRMLDISRLCSQHSIIPRGVIHIGAHEGHEIQKYSEMGMQKVLFIEANPTVFERLKANVAHIPNVQVANYAISDCNGQVTLHVTSMDQSSSILPLKLHREQFPNVREVRCITVPARRLDTLLQELGLSLSNYNLLNIDIQGAELLALKGAENILKHIQAINTEVNYEELYEGCVIIDQLDEFLNKYGFERIATTTPYHQSWGDAFYVRRQHSSSNL